jgi:hypothetical protein
MAGPTLKLRARTFGKPEMHKLRILLHRMAILVLEAENEFEFHFKKGKTLGASLKINSCLFVLTITLKEHEEDELRIGDLKEKLNDQPEAYILVSAMCNEAIDHLLLANFALEINKIVGGYIDLNGAIIPDLAKDKNGNYIHQTQEDYRKFVNKLKGEIHEVGYTMDENRSSYSHICDAQWLQDWSTQPEFRLIK